MVHNFPLIWSQVGLKSNKYFDKNGKLIKGGKEPFIGIKNLLVV